MPRSVLFINACTSMWGAEESMLELAEELEELGYETHLMTCLEQLESTWNVRVSPAPTIRVRASRRESSFGRLLRTVAFSFRTATVPPAEVVVIFSHYLLPLAALLRVQSRILRRPQPCIVFDVHDNLSTPRASFVTRAFIRFVDQVIVVSHFTASHLPADRPSTHVLYRSIRPPSAKPDTRSHEPFICGVVGRIDPEKNHALVVEAIAALPHVHLAIRGSAAATDTQYADGVTQKARARLGDRLHLDGRVPRDSALDNLDVLIVANAEEPMGRTVGEAQLAGIPVITPNVGGSSELVEHEVTGLAYRAGDALDLQKSIERMRLDPNLRARVVSAAKIAARSRHGISAYARSYAAAFGDLNQQRH